MNPRIYTHTPELRARDHYRNRIEFDLYHSDPATGFYHQATVGRIRRNYRQLRDAGIAASTARLIISEILFAAHMARGSDYRSDVVASRVA